MKTLYLPLKAQWYDMIEADVKKEEYREITDYWYSRIWRHRLSITHVCFSYGYTKRRMTFEVENIAIGRGKPEWGAPEDRDVYIIKLK
ncbi:MAG: hypothetical protein IIV10_03895 [Alistipes sp.]|nr:hypothetical protein [Alistipes sp.]